MPEEIALDQNTAAPSSDAELQPKPLLEEEGKTAPDESAKSEQSDSELDEDSRPSRIPKWRFDEVYRRYREGERRAEQLERELQAERETKSKSQPPAHTPADDFDEFVQKNPHITDWNEIKKTFAVNLKKLGREEERTEQEQKTLASVKEQAHERFASELDKYEKDPTYNSFVAAKSKFDGPTLNFMEGVVSEFSNGIDVVKKAFLTPKIREHLEVLQKTRNGAAIQSLLTSISTSLLLAETDQADKEEEKPEPPVSKAPKPPTPVKKPSPTASFDVYDEKTDSDHWFRERNKQVYGK